MGPMGPMGPQKNYREEERVCATTSATFNYFSWGQGGGDSMKNPRNFIKNPGNVLIFPPSPFLGQTWPG